MAGVPVFQTDWDDFPRLDFNKPHSQHLIALDLTGLQITDPGLSNPWSVIMSGKTSRPASLIRDFYGSE